jgi:tyrosine-protein kinase Etk/Wzc
MPVSFEPDTRQLAASNSACHDEVDILDLLIVLSRGRKRILLFMFVATISSAIGALLLPNYFEARTSLLPPQPAQSSTNLMAGQLSAITGITTREFGLKNSADLYVALLASESVGNSLIERFRLQEIYGEPHVADARRVLAKRTRITAGKDGLITVLVEDRDPRRSSDLANAYAEELQRLNSRLAITEAAQRRLFFEQQLANVKEALLKAELQMVATERRTGMVELEAHAKALVEQVAVLRGQLAAKEVEVRAMQTFATEQNPDYRLAIREVAALRSQLASLEQGSGEGATGSMATLSEKSAEYVGRLREVKYQETLFEMISRQYEAARIDEAKEGSLLQVIDRATPPEKHSSPRRSFIVFAAILLAAFVASLWLLLEQSLYRAMTDPDRASKVSQLKLSWKRII